MKRLSRKEVAFSKVYAGTGDARYAAAHAGYASPISGYDALRRPDVQAEIRAQQALRLVNEALPAAVDCLIEIVRDKNQKGSSRVAAAKVIIGQTLGDRSSADGKEAHELTGEELAKAIAELEREASTRAKDVTPAPDPGVFD